MQVVHNYLLLHLVIDWAAWVAGWLNSTPEENDM